MSLGIFKVPTPVNEPVRSYAPGSPERASLKAKLAELKGQKIDMPMVINGHGVHTSKGANR